LLYNTGFLLSFASVLGISLFSERLTVFTRREKVLSAIRTGGGLWLFTLPVIVAAYFEFPLYSMMVNLIVVAFAPVLLSGGIAGALLGLIWPFAGMPFFFLAGLVIKINNLLTEFVACLPGAVVIAGSPGWGKILFYYVGIGALLYIHRKEKLNNKLTKSGTDLRMVGLKTLIIGTMLFVMTFNLSPGTRITFIDVGQGDSILIRCGNGSNVMIDSGSGNVKNVGERRVIPCLKAYGISRIHRFIITHPDADHINALDEILASNIEVGEILVALAQSNDETNKKLFDKVRNLNENSFNKTKIRFLQRGDSFEEGETYFKVIFPGRDGIASVNSVSESGVTDEGENDRNALSLVVEICEGDTKALFTGDLEKEGEEELINSGLLEDIDILKVAHHGSKYSTSEEFLKVTKPEIAVISCGRKNSYGHPHKETIRRLTDAGCRIYSTPEYGAVELAFGN
ncbi:MAG: ComEC/Rec2 family competence protein, partial [Lachnospiraceae bacterium]|nr:ComEC/Rec2 family competence protein [Lachnospiraceae bacterium]